MNSGMETVSISTKSALPNSRLSCSAMVLAQVGALGPGLGRTTRSGGVGPERGGGRSSVLGTGRLWTGEAGCFRSSRGDCGACGGRGGETETAAAGPASGLGSAGPRPAQAPPPPVEDPAQPRPSRLLTWASRTRGAGTRSGPAAAAEPQRPLETGTSISRGRVLCARTLREIGLAVFFNPCLVDTNKVTKVT